MEGKTRTQNNKAEKKKKATAQETRQRHKKCYKKVLGKAMHFVLSCVGDGRFC